MGCFSGTTPAVPLPVQHSEAGPAPLPPPCAHRTSGERTPLGSFGEQRDTRWGSARSRTPAPRNRPTDLTFRVWLCCFSPPPPPLFLYRVSIWESTDTALNRSGVTSVYNAPPPGAALPREAAGRHPRAEGKREERREVPAVPPRSRRRPRGAQQVRSAAPCPERCPPGGGRLFTHARQPTRPRRRAG